MTKRDIFEDLQYEEGDQLFIVNIGREKMQRINVGFSVFELFGCCEMIKQDLLDVMRGEVEVGIKEVSRTKMEDKEATN